MNPPPGYELLCELGRGTTGVVYKARDTRLDYLVAIKFPLPCSDAERAEQHQRFREQARLLASVEHDSIIKVYWILEHDGAPYCVRQFIPRTLEKVAQAKVLDRQMASMLVWSVADAMRTIHARGYAHCNLTPTTILVEHLILPKLIGFGRAKQLTDPLALEDIKALQQLVRWLLTTIGEPLSPELEHLCSTNECTTLAKLSWEIHRQI